MLPPPFLSIGIRPGIWDGADAAMGPALPADYADLKVGGNIFIEFLHVRTGKNHVVLHVPLEEPVMMGETVYYAVPIVVDLADEVFPVLDNSGVRTNDYYPGQLNVKLLKFNTPSATEQHLLSFVIFKDDLTVGALINVAKDANIHMFVFLAYTWFIEPKVWKGCRDFIYIRSSSLQYWLLLANKGIIEATTAEGVRLTDRIAFVYIKGEDARPRPVYKSDFVRFNRDETEAHVMGALVDYEAKATGML